MTVTGRKQDDDEQESEIIYINPHKDVWEYSVPLTHETEKQTENFKDIAAKALAKKIVEMIEPDYFENEGYELMRYRIIIKKHP